LTCLTYCSGPGGSSYYPVPVYTDTTLFRGHGPAHHAAHVAAPSHLVHHAVPAPAHVVAHHAAHHLPAVAHHVPAVAHHVPAVAHHAVHGVAPVAHHVPAVAHHVAHGVHHPVAPLASVAPLTHPAPVHHVAHHAVHAAPAVAHHIAHAAPAVAHHVPVVHHAVHDVAPAVYNEVVPVYPEHKPHHIIHKAYEPEYPDEPRLYKYAYSVDDDYEGAVLNVKESSDEYETHGSYEVSLDDGRHQSVSYVSDKHGGYKAKVAYKDQHSSYTRT